MQSKDHHLCVVGLFGVPHEYCTKLLFVALLILEYRLINDYLASENLICLLTIFDAFQNRLFKLLDKAHVLEGLQVDLVEAIDSIRIGHGIQEILWRDVDLTNA